MVVLHDLNLAMRWADRIVVIEQGTVYAVGTVAEALTPEVIAAVYGVYARVERCSHDRLHIIVDGAGTHEPDARTKVSGGNGG
jgi:iron complex transport system ATP-binding protein